MLVLCLNNDFNELVLIQNPPVLYKYREWANNPHHQKVLINNQLYFSQVKTFHEDDPNDCVAGLKRYSKEEIEEMLSQHYQRHYSKYGEDIKSLVSKHDKSHFKDQNLLEKSLQSYDEDFDKDSGILCLTGNPLNYKMWESYGGMNTGICYGFRIPELYLDLNIDRKLCVGKVVYPNEKPLYDPKDALDIGVFKRVYCKDKEYCFEDEYRLRKRPLKTARDREAYFSNTTFDSIYLGKDIAPNDELEVVEAIKNKKLNISVFKCVSDNGKLSRNRIL